MKGCLSDKRFRAVVATYGGVERRVVFSVRAQDIQCPVAVSRELWSIASEGSITELFQLCVKVGCIIVKEYTRGIRIKGFLVKIKVEFNVFVCKNSEWSGFQKFGESGCTGFKNGERGGIRITIHGFNAVYSIITGKEERG